MTETELETSKPKAKLTGKDVFVLTLKTYWASVPYVLLFILVMLVATWLVTEVLFR